jgi:hypothetical protein
MNNAVSVSDRPNRSADTRRLWVVVLWVVLGLAVTVKTVASPERHTLFPTLTQRTALWWAGSSMYAEIEGLGKFPYSPSFAIVFTPFATLGCVLGAILWSWLGIGAYFLGLRAIARDVLPGPWPAVREAAFLGFALIGAVRGFWNAQSNALIIGLVMLGVAAAAQKKWWRAAFLLAVPVYIKIWPIVFGLLCVGLWPRRLGPRFLVALLTGAAIPFAVPPYGTAIDQYRAWFDLLADMAREPQGPYRDLWTVLNRLAIPMPRIAYRVLQAAVGVALVIWCLACRRRTEAVTAALTLALCGGSAYAMLLGPGVEFNTMVVLAPAATWALMTAHEQRRGRLAVSAAFLMTMLLGAGAIERKLVAFVPWAVATLPAGVILFAFWLLRHGPACTRLALAADDPKPSIESRFT